MACRNNLRLSILLHLELESPEQAAMKGRWKENIEYLPRKSENTMLGQCRERERERKLVIYDLISLKSMRGILNIGLLCHHTSFYI